MLRIVLLAMSHTPTETPFELIVGILPPSENVSLLVLTSNLIATLERCSGYLHRLTWKQIGIVEASRIPNGLVDREEFNCIERMPKPSCAEQPTVGWIHCQPRMKEVTGLASRRVRQSLTSFRIFNIDSTVVLRANGSGPHVHLTKSQSKQGTHRHSHDSSCD